MRLDELTPSPKTKRLPSLKTFAAWILVVAFLLGMMWTISGLEVVYSDYRFFHLAAVRLVQGENAYGIQPNGVQGFFNPLWAIFPLISFTALDQPLAFQLWRLFILLTFLPATYLIMRLYRLPPTPFLTLLIGLFISVPWYIGQNSSLVAVGVFLAILFASDERWMMAGAMIPLIFIKPQTVLLFPLALAWRGRARAVAGMILGGGIASVGAGLAQWDWVTAWLNSRWGDSEGSVGVTWLSAGLGNVLDLLHLPNGIYLIGVAAGLYLFWRYRHLDWRQWSALALGLGATLTPYIRPQDFLLLLPIIFLLPPRWVYALTPAWVFFFAGPLPYPLMWLIPFSVTLAFVIAAERRVLRLTPARVAA